MNTLVFIEARGGDVKKASLETLGEARRLTDPTGGRVFAMILGSDLSTEVESVSSAGAHVLLVGNAPVFEVAVADALSAEIVAAVEEHDIQLVMFATTTLGRELASLVACRKDTCVAMDCTSLELEGDLLVAERPIYAGKALLTVEIAHRPAVVTLRPNCGTVFEGGDPGEQLEWIPRTESGGVVEALLE